MTTILNQIELIADDADVAGRDFAAIVDVIPEYISEESARVAVGAFRVTFSQRALVPLTPSGGVVLHIQVDDVDAEHRRLVALGSTILLEPTETAPGTRALYVEAPGVIVAFYSAA